MAGYEKRCRGCHIAVTQAVPANGGFRMAKTLLSPGVKVCRSDGVAGCRRPPTQTAGEVTTASKELTAPTTGQTGFSTASGRLEEVQSSAQDDACSQKRPVSQKGLLARAAKTTEVGATATTVPVSSTGVRITQPAKSG